ncbi:hypothetical protein P3S68_018548 [Capsicum galapagoense]
MAKNQYGNFTERKGKGNLLEDPPLLNLTRRSLLLALRETTQTVGYVNSKTNQTPTTCQRERLFLRKNLLHTALLVKLILYAVRPYCLLKNHLYLPKRFARENGLINKKCDLVIRDERERSWNLKLNTYNHGVYTGEGWHEVCVDNDLKEGDCIKFEVVTNKEKPIWKFHEGKLPADEPPILPPLPLVLKNEKRKAPYVTPQSKKFEYRDWDCDRECDRDYDLMHPPGSHKKDFASPVDVEQPIDSNEPTYCVCNQAKFLQVCGTLTDTPTEIRNCSMKCKNHLATMKEVDPLKFRS